MSCNYVIEELLRRYGRKLSTVEMLSDGVYRVYLTNGSLIAAFATDKGLVTKALSNVGA